MQVYFEDTHFIVNGIEYPFHCVIQQTHGQKIVVNPHYHTHIEILYCNSGSFRIFLGGHHYDFKDGDFVIVNSMEVHSVESTTPGLNAYLVLRLLPEMLHSGISTIAEYKYVLPFILRNASHQTVFSKQELAGSNMHAIMNHLLEENTRKQYGFELAIKNCIGEIFLWIHRYWAQNDTSNLNNNSINKRNLLRLQQINDYLNGNYMNPISVDEMAQLCNMSYSYFSKFFKQTTGKAFSDYLNQIRIQKAERLLATTDDSITEISYAVGFSSTSYFISHFKKEKNITPKKYRSLLKMQT